jgi:hypothetical protein
MTADKFINTVGFLLRAAKDRRLCWAAVTDHIIA